MPTFSLAIQDQTASIETTATMLTFGQWINNKETPSLDAATIDVENPTDNSIVGKVPAGCAADAEAALTSAKKAQVAWAKVPVGTRAKVLKGFAEVIRGCREELIETLIAEQSKVAGLATVEIGAFCLLCLAALHAFFIYLCLVCIFTCVHIRLIWHQTLLHRDGRIKSDAHERFPLIYLTFSPFDYK